MSGYIVVNKDQPLTLCYGEEYPTSGVLLGGDFVTVFETPESALEAIDRTLAWAEVERRANNKSEWAKFAWSYSHCYSLRPVIPPGVDQVPIPHVDRIRCYCEGCTE